jgi:hypothetical protein
MDLFPTILGLMNVPYTKKMSSAIPPMGRSLQPIIMGTSAQSTPVSGKQQGAPSPSIVSLRKRILHHKFNFALSQSLMCSNPAWEELFDNTGSFIHGVNANVSEGGLSVEDLILDRKTTMNFWTFCNFDVKSKAAIMGYSVRTKEFRYTAYIPVDYTTLAPDFSQGSVVLPWAEELYDHRHESLWSDKSVLDKLVNPNEEDATAMLVDDASNPSSGSSSFGVAASSTPAHGHYGQWEIQNVVDDPHYSAVVAHYRNTLLDMLRGTMRYSKLPINKHSKEFIENQRLYKASQPAVGAFRFKTFNNIVRKQQPSATAASADGQGGGTNAATNIVALPQSPQREWQSLQTRLGAVVDSRKYSNELFGGVGNYGVNVLFIMYDDLRPELSIYGRNHMMTPNFERLAKRSVVFDYCYTQVAVCNPSRNVMLTGLRPDTKRSYAFDVGPEPHVVLPTALKRIGYETSQAGKLFHWDGPNADIWDHFWDWDWYGYQNREWDWMKSTVMPDKIKKEESFPDHLIATETIKSLRQFHSRAQQGIEHQQKFMIAAGFKMPHTALHIPHRYFDMYRHLNSTDVWTLKDEERTYPSNAPAHSFRCCTDTVFRFMKNEGADNSERSEPLGDINHVFSQEAYSENMWGYSAAITYLDFQLGRILDVLDELDLWKNLTIILTADHGIHNGEKGIW